MTCLVVWVSYHRIEDELYALVFMKSDAKFVSDQ